MESIINGNVSLNNILHVESGIIYREQLFVDIYGKRINIPHNADIYIYIKLGIIYHSL